MKAVNHRIKITRTAQSRLPEVDFDDIPFGRVFSDHMLAADYRDGAWQEPEILPYGTFSIHPCMTALHYAQAIFEGMKAFRSVRGEPVLFRPRDNFLRFNRSAERMVMPELPEELFVEGLKELVRLDADWIPRKEGSSLYLRPFMFASDEYIGVKPSDDYTFMIITCPVGPYYTKPVSLWVTKEYVRACEGGTGAAKAAGNYAASLLGAKKAQELGYDTVLWLDGKEHRYVEECGTMNIFFVIDGTLVTPSLTGTILPGITRDSVITLARDMGIPVEERRVAIEELAGAHQKGKLNECFGAGTAATITHVERIGYEGRDLVLPPVKERKIAPRLLRKLDDIRTGRTDDPYGWVVKL